MRSPRQRLGDIIEAIDLIRQAEAVLVVVENNNDHGQASLAFDAISYRRIVVGDAVKALPACLRGQEADVPWTDIARLRDLLTHPYPRVNATILRAPSTDPWLSSTPLPTGCGLSSRRTATLGQTG